MYVMCVVLKLINEHFSGAEEIKITPETRFSEDLHFTEDDRKKLYGMISGHLGIKVEPDISIKTVNELCEYIENL